MNVQLLIGALVQQVTVLIAQLATAGGVRAPIAHVANQVFLDLARELEAQGVSRKVSADMFGLALRSYQRKLRRLSESSTFRGRSLWEAVLSFVPMERPILQAEILRRFGADDPVSVRGVLADLSDSGLLYRTGSGAGVAYRATTVAEANALTAWEHEPRVDELVWAIAYREGPLTMNEITRRVGPARIDAEEVVARLVQSGRLEVMARGSTEPTYRAGHFTIPLGAEQGWEASVFDHFQAVVKTITARLTDGGPGGAGAEVGGSTYSFHVGAGHPLEDEVRGSLADFRKRLGELRARVAEVNAARPLAEQHTQVTIYVGQCLTPMGEEDETNQIT